MNLSCLFGHSYKSRLVLKSTMGFGVSYKALKEYECTVCEKRKDEEIVSGHEFRVCYKLQTLGITKIINEVEHCKLFIEEELKNHGIENV